MLDFGNTKMDNTQPLFQGTLKSRVEIKPGKWDCHGPTVKSRKSGALVLRETGRLPASHW